MESNTVIDGDNNGSFNELLRQKQFVRFWFARVAGIMGNQMLLVALAWHMYELTSSAWDLGLVGLFQFVPVLVMALPAGHVADNFHRARIFAFCMLAQATMGLTLIIANQHGFATRELIFAVSIVMGVARAFQMPAHQALTPLLVPKHLLTRAIALSSSGVQTAVICGPALGGLLYALGSTTVYASCSALLLLACALTLLVRYEHKPIKTAVDLRSVLAGVVFIYRHKILLGATLLDLFAVLLGGATALLPIYARDILHVGPQGLGLLRAAPAVGALIMSVILIRWPIERKVGARLLAAVAVFGLGIALFGLSTNFLLSLIALAITGAADNVSVITRLTLMQLETPNEIRGRVSAVNSIFIGASNQLGEFESGATAALMGPVASVVMGGVGTLLIALTWIRLFPGLAQRDEMNVKKIDR